MVTRIFKWALPFITFMAPSLIAGALIGIYPGYKAYEYTWVESGFCTRCHIHDYANISWKKSVHGAVTTCHDCHHQPLIQYLEEAVALVTKKPSFPVDLKHVPHVDKHLCETCHWDFGKSGKPDVAGPLKAHDLKDIPKVSNTRLHKLHLSKQVKLPFPSKQHLDTQPTDNLVNTSMIGYESKEVGKKEWASRDITCVDCHGGIANRAHNFSATDIACVRCHNAMHKDFAPSKVQATFGCRNCHFIEFMVETPSSEPDEGFRKEH